MSRLTDNPNDPDLGRGVDHEPTTMNAAYLVLSDEERAKGFVRPVRCEYIHQTCDTSTVMSLQLAETYARDPKFYGATWCCQCRMHRPVDEFTWVENGSDTGIRVGT